MKPVQNTPVEGNTIDIEGIGPTALYSVMCPHCHVYMIFVRFFDRSIEEQCEAVLRRHQCPPGRPIMGITCSS